MIVTIFFQLGKLLLEIILGLFIIFIILRTSNFWIGINLINQVKLNNKSAALVSIGLMLMIAIVIGLSKI